jgi:RNA polymerase primary sigma factor
MSVSFYQEKAQTDHRDALDPGEDLLRQYLREMGKAPLLTREREVQLSKLIHEGRRKITQVQKIQRHPHGPARAGTRLRDLRVELKKTEAELRAAEAEMVRCNLRLVVSIAKAYVG